jgi:hypothetical protein
VSVTLDLSTDFATVTDGLAKVIVDGFDVDACLRRAVSVREAAASGGKYLSTDVAFHLDAQELPAPSIGGKITDVDGEWTILGIDWQTLVNRWRCVSRKLSIANGILVTIQRATYTKSATGAEEPTWADTAANVLARIQLTGAEMEVVNTNRTSRIDARVFFATEQTLGPSYRILGSGGQILKVLSWDGFDEINQLFAATCEVSKWPHS